MSGKCLSPSDLNERRHQAVRLRLQGNTLKQVCEQTGLSAPTVIAAHKAFLDGGWAAIDVKSRGRRPGLGNPAATLDEAGLAQKLLCTLPEEVNPNYRLWSLSALAEWLHLEQGISPSSRTVARYAQRWGFNPAAPHTNHQSDASTPLQRLESHHPALLRRARQQDAEILWGGESPYRAPHAPATASLLYARSARDKLRWWVSSEGLNTGAVIDFLSRLTRDVGRKVILLFEGVDLNRFDDVRWWLHEHRERIELKILSAPAPGLASTRAQAPVPTEKNTKKLPMLEKGMTLTHLQRLEAESIHIIREVVAETENPVMLYSIGKDSAVMLHLARKAFYPAPPPFPLLHVDTGWKFRDMYTFRDRMAEEAGMDLLVHINPEGVEKGINPFTHGSTIHTDVMKTEGLKQALEKYGFDAAFGGARRDEEKSRAKERIFSFRTAQHRWDPKNQRPELWRVYNARKHKGESIRVFPLSNWTELDIWQYIHREQIPIVPLYFAAERPVVMRDGMLIMVDDQRMPLKSGEVPVMRKVRFRTLGCYPLTGAVESAADTLPAIIQETLLATTSERQGRVIDSDSASSMEKKKKEGYF